MKRIVNHVENVALGRAYRMIRIVDGAQFGYDYVVTHDILDDPRRAAKALRYVRRHFLEAISRVAV